MRINHVPGYLFKRDSDTKNWICPFSKKYIKDAIQYTIFAKLSLLVGPSNPGGVAELGCRDS
jgi:hypothetical protein